MACHSQEGKHDHAPEILVCVCFRQQSRSSLHQLTIRDQIFVDYKSTGWSGLFYSQPAIRNSPSYLGESQSILLGSQVDVYIYIAYGKVTCTIISTPLASLVRCGQAADEWLHTGELGEEGLYEQLLSHLHKRPECGDAPSWYSYLTPADDDKPGSHVLPTALNYVRLAK